MTVISILLLNSLILFSIIEWWAQVIVNPDLSKIIVFKRGIWIGLKGFTPRGGHLIPISIVGASILWKNPQKNDKKKNTSDVINKIIPHFILLITLWVWIPWKVLSRDTSRHHRMDVVIIRTLPIYNVLEEYKLNQIDRPKVVTIALKEATIGHGLWSTRWKGWFFFTNIN